MSLLDALLLEPPKFDVWIALRTDGVRGSGTQADPYDGSTIKTAPLRIASLSGNRFRIAQKNFPGLAPRARP